MCIPEIQSSNILWKQATFPQKIDLILNQSQPNTINHPKKHKKEKYPNEIWNLGFEHEKSQT